MSETGRRAPVGSVAKETNPRSERRKQNPSQLTGESGLHSSN